MSNRKFTFDKRNYQLLLAGAIIIIIGFLLMSGPGSTETHFEPDIFSFRRIKLAPAVCFIGFISIIYAIMYKPKDKNTDENKK